MKKYIEYIVLISIILVLSTILYLDKSNKIHYKLPSIPKIEKKDINKVVLSKGKNKPIVLTLKKDVWIINNNPKYKADSKKIEFILNDISKLKLMSMVSRGEDYRRYSLDDKNKIQICAWSKSKQPFCFSIGKLSPNYSSTYVKLDKNPAIYLAQGNLRLTFDTDLDELRDKHILAFNVKEIDQIKINFKGTSVTIEKDNGKWTSKEKIRDSNVNELLQKLQTIECESFLKDHKNEQIGKNYLKIELITNSSTHFLRLQKIKDKNTNKFIGYSSNLPEKFILSEYVVKDLEGILEKILNKENR